MAYKNFSNAGLEKLPVFLISWYPDPEALFVRPKG